MSDTFDFHATDLWNVRFVECDSRNGPDASREKDGSRWPRDCACFPADMSVHVTC